MHKLRKNFPQELKKHDYHCLVIVRANLQEKSIKFKRSLCKKQLLDFDLFLNVKGSHEKRDFHFSF